MNAVLLHHCLLSSEQSPACMSVNIIVFELQLAISHCVWDTSNHVETVYTVKDLFDVPLYNTLI